MHCSSALQFKDWILYLRQSLNLDKSIESWKTLDAQVVHFKETLSDLDDVCIVRSHDSKLFWMDRECECEDGDGNRADVFVFVNRCIVFV